MSGGRPHLGLSEQGTIWVTSQGDKYIAGSWVRLRSGKRKQVTASAPTKSAARRKLQAKVDALANPVADGVQPTWTVNALAVHWLEKKRRQGNARNGAPLAPQTLWMYNDQIRRIIGPSVGALRVHELTVPGLEAAFENLEDLGISTMACRSVLNMMCALATRDGALQSNPLPLVSTPAREFKEVEVLSVAEARRLLRVIEPDAVRIPGRRRPNRDLLDVVTLGLATGARIGELLAVQRQHLDLDSDAPTLTISGTLVEPRKGFVDKLDRQEATKTGAVRTLLLPDSALAMVGERLAKAKSDSPETPLFASRTGNWLWPSNIRTRLRAAVGDDETLSGTTPNTLRRSVASLVGYEAGFDAARMQLGHSLLGSTPLARYVAYRSEAPDLREILETFFED